MKKMKRRQRSLTIFFVPASSRYIYICFTSFSVFAYGLLLSHLGERLALYYQKSCDKNLASATSAIPLDVRYSVGIY
ncbi:unnamed protein product [Amoebophrya sp. A120]|nr:unnamed protein product [Amoebophrya sp. A120]|eukprot:GSA120T00013575001.1